MRKYIVIVLCLLLAFSLAACAAATGSPGSEVTLDIDYITTSDHQEEIIEEDSDSLFGWLQQRLRADAQGPATAQGTAQGDATSAQNNPVEGGVEQAASSGSSSGNTPNAGSPGSSQGQGFSSGGGTLSAQPNNPAGTPDETEPENEGEPEPTSPQRNTVTLHIRVDTAVAAGMHLNPQWAGIVPPSGIILPTTTFEFQPGDTVYDVLRQAGRVHGINISSRGTTFGIYVEGINGLFEFDGVFADGNDAHGSGWMYSVNGWYPNFGAARYFVQPGDRIEWNYTMDLGLDLGVDMSAW